MARATALRWAQDHRPDSDEELMPGSNPFSDRELEVLELIAYGLTNREVADRLFASHHTVRAHASSIHGPTKHLLSKSPANSGRIGTLAETFPDAKFIYATRDPTALVPSTMTLFSFQWNAFSDLLDEHPFRESVLEMTKQWYRCPVRRLRGNSLTGDQ